MSGSIEAPRRWFRVHLAALLVLVLGLALTVAGVTRARAAVSEGDRRLLEQNADDAAQLFEVYVESLRDRLGSAGAVARATEADPAAFMRFVRGGVVRNDGGVLALARVSDGGFEAVACSCEGLAVFDAASSSTSIAEQLRAAAAGLGTPHLVGPVDAEGGRALALVVGPPAAPDGHVVVEEFTFPTVAPAQPGDEAEGGVDGLDFAMYAREGDPGSLALSTTTDLPLRGRTAERDIPLGSTSLHMVFAPRAALEGSTPAVLPWVAGLTGLALTAMATAVVEVGLRRRRESRASLADLARSEGRFRSVLANSPDIVVTVDREGRFAVLNRDEVFGHPAEQFTSLDLCVGPSDLLAVGAAFDEARRASAGVHEVEFRVTRADGALDWVRARVTPLGTGPDGSAEQLLATLSIVTAERDGDSAREALEARLRQSQRLEAIGQLAGGVAHDFNNILAAILSYADLAATALPAGEVREDVEQIRGAARRGANLTRQLLQFSRRDALTPELIDVGEVVRDMEEMLSRTLTEAIELRTEVADALPAVLCDRGELEQVFMNLVVNARDAMPSGGTVTIKASAVQTDVPFVHIAVTDTGTGMTPDVAERVFEPFFTTKEHGRGTGLGLATVYGIARALGGHVSLRSTPGEGTTIDVMLPARARGEVAAPVEKVVPESGAGGRILVVEDEDAVRVATARLLERAGYQVASASSGREAMRLLDAGSADVLLTDVVMPGGVSGLDLATDFSARNPLLRVVYMSGFSDDVIDPADLDSVRMLAKPFTEDELLSTVRDAMAGVG